MSEPKTSPQNSNDLITAIYAGLGECHTRKKQALQLIQQLDAQIDSYERQLLDQIPKES